MVKAVVGGKHNDRPKPNCQREKTLYDSLLPNLEQEIFNII